LGAPVKKAMGQAARETAYENAQTGLGGGEKYATEKNLGEKSAGKPRVSREKRIRRGS